eukprot:Clim_evm21s161 gene=Clim_evmTU21s161
MLGRAFNRAPVLLRKSVTSVPKGQVRANASKVSKREPNFLERNGALIFSMVAIGAGVQWYQTEKKLEDYKTQAAKDKEALERELTVYRLAFSPDYDSSSPELQITKLINQRVSARAAQTWWKSLTWEQTMTEMHEVFITIKKEASRLGSQQMTLSDMLALGDKATGNATHGTSSAPAVPVIQQPITSSGASADSGKHRVIR